MRFFDFYQKSRFRYSLEVFPPKTEKGVLDLIKELKALETINPAYVSVTYGALGSTRDCTKAMAFQIYDKIRAHTAFHFTCIGMDKDEIKKYVDVLYQKGVNFIVALRGDIPQGENEFKPPEGGFQYASDLVAYLKTLHDFSIAVAGYPEKHPEASNLASDIQNLKIKVDAGADVIVTQLFFDNPLFYGWLEKIRQSGITVPVIPGIMPILKLSQIQRISRLCGASLPRTLIQELERFQHDEHAMREIGIAHAARQCEDLIKSGVQGIHFFCLNKAYSVLKIAEACRGLIY